VGVVLGVLAWLVPPAVAQNENETVGFQTNHAFESGLFGENIDILNGGLTLTVPIGPRYQVNQNLGYQLQLAYGSKIWDTTLWHTNAPVPLHRRAHLGQGFIMHLGRIYRDVECRQGSSGCTNRYTWYYVAPDGSEHEIPGMEPDGECGSSGDYGLTIDNTWSSVSATAIGGGAPDLWNHPELAIWTLTTREGIRYTFGHYIDVKAAGGGQFNSSQCVATNGLYTAYNRDFGGWYVTRIEDTRAVSCADVCPSPAYVTITYDTAHPGNPGYEHAIKTITDSAGRTITFNNGCVLDPDTGQCWERALPNQTSDPANSPKRGSVCTDSIDMPAFGGSSDPLGSAVARYRFTYDFAKLDELGGQPDVVPASLLREVHFPDFRTNVPGAVKPGYVLSLGYNNFGELVSRTLPTGADIDYIWGSYAYVGQGGWGFGYSVNAFTRQIVEKRVNLGADVTHRWTYTRLTTSGSNPSRVNVVDPLGNETIYYYRASYHDPNADPSVVDDDLNNGFIPEWDDGVNWKTEYFQGNGTAGRLLRTELRDYDADCARRACPGKAKWNVRVKRQVTIHSEGAARRSTVAYGGWDQNLGYYTTTTESGDDIPGSRVTRTKFLDNDNTRPLFVEVSDDRRVISRVDNLYVRQGLKASIARAKLPAVVGTPHNTVPDSASGDVTTVYTYDDTANVILKEVTQQGFTWNGVNPDTITATSPQYRIRYSWQAGGYLATKELYNWSAGAYYTWKAIDRSRDGNTGLILASRDPAGIATSYSYDELGRVKKISPTSPEYPTEIEYLDALHTTVRQGDPALLQSTEDSFRCHLNPAPTVDYIMSCYEYDTLGRLTKTQKRPLDPNLGYPYQTTTHDVLGRVTFQSEWLWPSQTGCTPPPAPSSCPLTAAPSSCGTTFDFCDPQGTPQSDPFGRVRRQTTADGKITEFLYSGPTSTVIVKGIQGPGGLLPDAATTYHRDVWGRLITVQTPDGGGANAVYAYDFRDNLIQVELQEKSTLRRQTRAFDYDALNRLRASTNPENGTQVVTGYDALGNVTEQRDASGNRLFSIYDGAGRLTQIRRQDYQRPGGSAPPVVLLQENTFDKAGAVDCPGGGVPDSTFGWCNGRVTKVQDFADTGLLAHTREFYYAGLNGRVSVERHLFSDWPAGTVAPIGTAYNNFGLPSRTSYPEGPSGLGGAFGVDYKYLNGYPHRVLDAGGSGATHATFAYNAAGGIQTVTNPGGGQTSLTFDARNRPQSITGGVWDPNTGWTYQSGTYVYDGAGNISGIGSNQYGYDAANRLVGAIDTYSTAIRQEYVYDEFGNMIQKDQYNVGSGLLTRRDLFTVTDQTTGINTNRIRDHQVDTSSPVLFTYDPRGNLTSADGQVYEYDTRNRVLSVRSRSNQVDTELARYIYDGGANRLRKEDMGRDLWTYFVRDGQGRLLSQFRRNKRGAYVPEWSKHYVYLGGRLVALRENLVPPLPSGLTATTSRQDRTVTLAWRANPTDEGVTISKYKVYRSLLVTPPVWELRGETDSWILGFTDAVEIDVTYQYAVTALSSAGHESYGHGILVVVAGDKTDPSKPTGLQARAGDQRVELTWLQNPPTEYVIGYHVYRGSGQSATRITQAPLIGTSFVDQGLANGLTYAYSITAVDSASLESRRSDEVPATPNDFTPPGAPHRLTATVPCEATGGSVQVTWEPNAWTETLSHYLLFREPAWPNEIQSRQVSGTNYADAETNAGQIYTYYVKAVDLNQNQSEESLRVSVKTRNPAGMLDPPVTPYAHAGDGRVSLRIFVPTSPAGTKLNVYRKPNAEASCDRYEFLDTIATGVGAYLDFEDGAAPNSVAYDYALTYVNSAGEESDFSVSALAIPVAAPLNYRACTEIIREGPQPWLNWRDGYDQCWFDGDTTELGRQIVRWSAPGAQQYQPTQVSSGDGPVGYLKGYRLYKYLATGSSGTEPPVLEAQPADRSKRFCQNNPHIPCGPSSFAIPEACPSGDTCVSAPVYGECSSNRSISCLQDGDCPAGATCRTPCALCEFACGLGTVCAEPLWDPFLTMYRDGGINTHQRLWGREKSCLAAKAVHKVFANGTFLTVESELSDNFDPRRSDAGDDWRCVGYTPHPCHNLIPDSLLVEALCAFDESVPPMPPPAAPTADADQPPGILRVTWQPSPAGICALEFPVTCTSSSDCGSGQYCRFPAPFYDTGTCALVTETTCTVSSDCPQGTVQSEQQICKAVPIAGYHLYAREAHPSRFVRPAPVVSVPPHQTWYTFKKGFGGAYFRVAAFDGSGRISEMTPESAELWASSEGTGNPAPTAVRTVAWTINDYNWPQMDGVKLQWGWNGNRGTLDGFRVWRSTTAGGPYCALVQQGGTSLPTCPGDRPAYSQTLTTAYPETPTWYWFADETALPGVMYYYVVTAVTTSGESPRSLEVTGKFMGRDGNPSPPAHFKAWTATNAADQPGVYLRWCPNLSGESVDRYKVLRASQSRGPYTEIADLPASCIESGHRCVITGIGQWTETQTCAPGITGDCRVVDRSVTSGTYYYTVKAVSGGLVSGYSTENLGTPVTAYDPDNFPDIPCGEVERVSLEGDEQIIAQSGADQDATTSVAPYLTIGQIVVDDPPPPPPPGPTTPPTSVRFVYFHLDHLGSPRVITDSSGAVISKHHYMPFGEELPVAPMNSGNKRHFTGHERDPESGLDYMVARYYSSSLGRFLAVDPSGRSVSPARPQSWNRYEYALNNPLGHVDPDGGFARALHQREAGRVLQMFPDFWTPGDVAWIANRTRTIDEFFSETGPLRNPDLHFKGAVVINHLADRAIEAYQRGDHNTGNEFAAQAMHAAFDSSGGAHEGTSPLTHALRAVGGAIQRFVGARDTLNPDSRFSPGYFFRFVQGVLNMIGVASYIRNGQTGGDFQDSVPTPAFMLEVDMTEYSYFEALEVADKYADRGYGVYIDGQCYRNC
jgi:RHS repeat-associated protein